MSHRCCWLWGLIHCCADSLIYAVTECSRLLLQLSLPDLLWDYKSCLLCSSDALHTCRLLQVCCAASARLLLAWSTVGTLDSQYCCTETGHAYAVDIPASRSL